MPSDPLSLTFGALAAPPARAILTRLADGDATVNALAEPFAMSKPAISRHLKVLEHAGLIVRGRAARWRPSRLEIEPLEEAAAWMQSRKRTWEDRMDRLDAHLRNQGAADDERLSTDQDGLITRVFDAPREQVFKAWTHPDEVARWYGPAHMDVPRDSVRIDARAGGRWELTMVPRGGGERFTIGYEILEFVEPELLVMCSDPMPGHA